jgi:hypothetical protein
VAGDEPGESRLPHGRLWVSPAVTAHSSLSSVPSLSSLPSLVRVRARVHSPHHTPTLNRLNAHVNAQFTVNSPVRRRASPPFPAAMPGTRSRHSPSLPGRLYIPLLARPPQARYVNDNFDPAKLNATFEKNKATRRATLMATQRIQASGSSGSRGSSGSSTSTSTSSHAHGDPEDTGEW